MGNAPSSASETGEKSTEAPATLINKLGISRPAAITEGKRTKGGSRPPGAVKASPDDLQYIQAYCPRLMPLLLLLLNTAFWRSCFVIVTLLTTLSDALPLPSANTRLSGNACDVACYMWRRSGDYFNALQECLAKVLFFGQLEDGLRARIAADMYERRVSAGEILIQEGDTGLTAAELYIVKEGEFEVRSRPCLRLSIVAWHTRDISAVQSAYMPVTRVHWRSSQLCTW